MQNKIKSYYLAKPSFSKTDLNNLSDVLKSGMLTQGKNVLELEQNINSLIETSFCSAVSNGTASLHLALIALGIGKEDEVIIPAFSYIATANVIELVGAKPIFVDINLNTFNIDINQIENKITKRTKCIMPVHEFGLCANMHEIIKIATKYNLKIIEDAACAIGSKYKNKFAGSFGDFASFSLHPRKSITSGEGGLVISNNKKYDHKIKCLRNHGVDPNSDNFEFIEAGFNYRLTDIQAAIVKDQVFQVESLIKHKANLARIYCDNLNTTKIILPHEPENYRHSWQTFHILLENNKQRNNLIEFLKKKNIYCNYGAQCIPEMSFYKKIYNLNTKKLFPNAFKAYNCGLAIPIHEKLNKEDILYISNNINKFLKNEK